MMHYDSFAMVAGDQADALVFTFVPGNPSLEGPRLHAVYLSADAPAFGWTLFFAPGAAAIEDNIVVLDSRAAIDVTPVNPVAAPVVNLSSNCMRLVPMDVVGTPFTLRVTTTGKVGTGIIRIVWSWENPAV